MKKEKRGGKEGVAAAPRSNFYGLELCAGLSLEWIYLDILILSP